MKLIHRFAEMTPDKRPQDPHMDGTGCRFEPMDQGGQYPDTMPQAIKLIDAEGRSAIYVPITQDGKVVERTMTGDVFFCALGMMQTSSVTSLTSLLTRSGHFVLNKPRA